MISTKRVYQNSFRGIDVSVSLKDKIITFNMKIFSYLKFKILNLVSLFAAEKSLNDGGSCNKRDVLESPLACCVPRPFTNK